MTTRALLVLPLVACAEPLSPDTGAVDVAEEKAALLPSVRQVTYTPSGTEFERIQGVAVGPDGAIYIAGQTDSSFPTTPGAWDSTPDDLYDAYVCRLVKGPLRVDWCTLLGGSDQDRIYDIAVTDSEVVAAGITYSDDFPGTAGGAQPLPGGDSEIFLARLSLDGTSLLGATYLGGAGHDWCRGEVIVLDDGRIAVSGDAQSTGMATAGAFDTSLQGVNDGFIAVYDADLSGLQWLTYVGGSGADQLLGGLKQDPVTGDLFAVGSTDSVDFPTTPGAFQEASQGGTDGMVVRFTTEGDLVAATYVGGSGVDRASFNSALVVDPRGRPTFLSNTESTDFPVSSSAWQQTPAGAVDGAVTRLSADLSTLQASTLLGGSGTEESSGIAIDATGAVVVSGNTGSTDFPVTGDAYQPDFAGDTDWFIAFFDTNLTALRTATYVGGSGTEDYGDRARDIEIDGPRIWVGGDTNSLDFPTTSGAMIPSVAPGRSNGGLVLLRR